MKRLNLVFIEKNYITRLCPHGLGDAWESRKTIEKGCLFSLDILRPRMQSLADDKFGSNYEV